MKEINESAFPFRWWEFLWYILIFVVGIIGNVLVIAVIFLNKKVETTSTFNILILVLATTDLLVSMVGLPIYILSTDMFHHPSGAHGDFLCMFFTGYFLPFFLLDISVFILVLIAVGRRRAIINPLSVFHDESKMRQILPILASTVLALGLGLPTVFGLKYTPSNPMVGNHCTYKYTYIQSIIIYCIVFVIDTIIPIVVLIICFQQIKQSFQSTNKFLINGQRLQNNKKYDVIINKKRKSIATMKYVVVAFFMCILPNHVLYLLSLAGVRGLEWNTVICQIGVLIRFTNSCINPILYSFKSERFRKNFQYTFPAVFHRKKVVFKNGSRRRDGYVCVEDTKTTSNIF